jgi:hypothetical protein
MLTHLKLWFLLAVVAVVSLAAGYSVPRPPKKGGDILDAVAAVQRRRPLVAIAERGPATNWVTEGGIYLSRVYKTPEQLDHLNQDPRVYDDRWDGVLYFKARGGRRDRRLAFLSAPNDRALDCGDFGIYGDPELLKEVRRILAEEGFEVARW